MTKITIATGLYPPDVGGPATHAKLLEEHLPHDVFQTTVVPFSRVRRWPFGIRHLLYILILLKHARKADVLYALDPVSVGLPARIVSGLTSAQLILRIPGDYAWEQAQQKSKKQESLMAFLQHIDRYPLKIRLLAKIERMVAKGARRVVVPSEYLKQIVRAWGVEEYRLTVIYSVFTPSSHVSDVARPKHSSTKPSFGRATSEEDSEPSQTPRDHPPHLITVGRLVPWKGFATLIEIMPELIKELPEPPLLTIIGDGPDYAALEARTRELDLAEHIRFLGPQEQSSLFAQIRDADLFVLNTAYEGFSHQLLEVMHLGTPIVTTDVGGNPELIEDGTHGLLVPYDDKAALKKAIARGLANEELREQLIENARARAESFSAERMITETAKLFQEQANA